jgi:hypothetical protein
LDGFQFIARLILLAQPPQNAGQLKARLARSWIQVQGLIELLFRLDKATQLRENEREIITGIVVIRHKRDCALKRGYRFRVLSTPR